MDATYRKCLVQLLKCSNGGASEKIVALNRETCFNCDQASEICVGIDKNFSILQTDSLSTFSAIEYSHLCRSLQYLFFSSGDLCEVSERHCLSATCELLLRPGLSVQLTPRSRIAEMKVVTLLTAVKSFLSSNLFTQV